MKQFVSFKSDLRFIISPLKALNMYIIVDLICRTIIWAMFQYEMIPEYLAQT